MSNAHPKRRRERACVELALLGIVALMLVNIPFVAAQSGLPNQTFDAATVPNGWSVVNNPADSKGWVFDNPGKRANETGSTGNFAIADSDNAGTGVKMDTQLRSPSFNTSGISLVQLHFRTYFRPANNAVGDIDVSVDGGTNWANVWRTTTALNGLVTVNLSAQAANQSNVIVRFRYYNAVWDWYWQLDDVAVIGLNAPTAPSNLTATVSGSNVTLAWQAAAEATSYKLQRSTNGTSWNDVASVTGGNTSYTDSKGVLCGTIYSYRVLASNAAGDSIASNLAAATTPACPLITNLNEAFTATTVPSGWTVQNNVGTDGWRFDDPGTRKTTTFNITNNFAIVDQLRGNDGAMDTELRTPQLNFTNLPGVSLSFRTYFSNSSSATVDVDVSSDNGVSWKNAWRQTNSIQDTLFRSIKLDLSASVGGKSNVLVRFRYHTANANGSGLWLIDDVELTSLPLPATPTNVVASLDSGGLIKLTWDSPAKDFEIDRAPGGSNSFQKIADVSRGNTSFVDSTVVTTTTYRYRIRAKNGGGVSPDSAIVEQTSGNRSVRFIDITVAYSSTVNINDRRAAIEGNIKYFADAVYEMSNGANKLRNIQIYDNQRTDNASIIWIDKCWPCANVAGYGKPGYNIEHCSLFNQTSFIADDEAYKQGGYTLAHELGHFFYSLYDEYVGTKATDKDGNPLGNSSPLPSDKPVSNSVMNSQFKAVNGDMSWLNFSTAQNNTGQTAQSRVFGASGWETLARDPDNDPRDGQRSTSPRRLYHPELAAVAPASGTAPRIELTGPAATAEARSALKFVWVGQATGNTQQVGTSFARQFVVDTSSAVTSNQLSSLKAVLKSLVDNANDGEMIGLIAYNSTVSVVQAPILLDTTARTALKTAIDGLTLSANPAALMGEALAAASSGPGAAGIPATASRAVYLFSAARHTGSHPFNETTTYNNAGISIYSFDMGSDDGLASELFNLADATEGSYYSIGDMIDLSLSLTEADQEASPQVDVMLDTAAGSASSSSVFTRSILIDSSLGAVTVEALYEGAASNATVSLTRPDGSPSGASFSTFTSNQSFGSAYSLASARINAPVAGLWTLTVSTAASHIALETIVSGEAKVDASTFFSEVESTTGDQVQYPTPMVIKAFVGQNFPIARAGVRGELVAPDGNVTPLTLRDDGVAPDHLADDGYYSAIVNYTSDGEHTINVFFDNNSGNGLFSEVAVAPAIGPDGSVRPVQKTPVGTNFQRVASTSVIVSGYEEDDHADDIEGATVIAPNNRSIAGRIDMADDYDVFKLVVPANYTDKLVLRVSNLALGMDPHITAFAEDKSWSVDQFLDTEPTSNSYLSLTLPPSAGKTIYIAVSHYNPKATQGLYELSVGPTITSEPAANGGLKTLYRSFLPLTYR